MSDEVLVIDNVSKRFGHFQALDRISLTINNGDIYGLIGENGAGKTTLMRLITGLSFLKQGQITLLGEAAGHYQQALRRTGAIIENPVAFPNLTVTQNLKLCAIQHGISEPHLIAETLGFVGLSAKQGTKAKQLSLGQRQRLGLALAILPRPDFLILDEPTNGLDPSGIIEFRQLIKQLNEERHTTILISSHILSELYQVSSRFGFIHQGRLIKELTKGELDLANQAGLALTVDHVTAASQVLDEAAVGEFAIMDEHHLIIHHSQLSAAAINQLLIQKGVAVSELVRQEGSLEQYYMNLVSGEEQRHVQSN
ncbi:ABC transporter ATP-binding protein [Lactiplantibacillus pingfangensis]|uniref:ABC transporter ATP-binding protein n=1 Tax=Lactiplantibacillus pingfangensis TaxID=2559915 RepID=UPI0010F7C21D|nr:ABC transporter ATP-binding protein [Lactiplantibacillus pingfangensis]